MTVRKIIELIDFIELIIGKENFSSLLQDYIVTIENNTSNLVLLKEITDKTISDYQILIENDIPDLLDKVLVNKIIPFTKDNFLLQLIDLKKINYSEPSTYYNVLNPILINLQARINENITELNKIKTIIQPFLSKDYSEIQNEKNAIFAIIFNEESTYNNLKLLSYELKNWDRCLHIYQQIVSDETPKAFEIIEVDQGSIEVVINLVFEVGAKLLELFKTGFEVYGAYLAYKTIIHENLVKTFNGNQALMKMEEEREKLMLGNIREVVRKELKTQAKKGKKHEALEKKIEEVTKLVTEHIIKGNSVKLLSAPKDKEEEIFPKENEKQKIFMANKINYNKLEESDKQLLLKEYTTTPPDESYEKE
ncbi:hypothetical protein IRZ83_04515 [Flavobacterium sp. JLP]|uniref:hypothetical protein n=1 Tax=Flavobacterium sp. JLP TaxID=2783793 RepID=UPI00188C5805|nr:hypothetical protein [Flavobacterium sp. JLP]MBF4505921.1 hypothetical protein [Flavobacterium sp. JLP]